MIIKLGSELLYLNYYRKEYKDKYNIIYKYLKDNDYVPGNVLFKWRSIGNHTTEIFIPISKDFIPLTSYIFILLIYME